MTQIHEIDARSWDLTLSQEQQLAAARHLEAGDVIYLPHLAFALEGDESGLLSPTLLGKRKNISYDPTLGRVKGTELPEETEQQLNQMMGRFAANARDLLVQLFPNYAQSLVLGRTSYRPAEIQGRESSWRKDDTRLHVDSFPSSPVQGRRILRLFANINPEGKSRSWRIGGRFEPIASQYLPKIAPPRWGSRKLMKVLHITKSERSAYDHFMLKLHDSMKADPEFQSGTEQIRQEFPPGSVWMVYTDQVPHAAMAGQYALEQTFYLPVSAMHDENTTPLRVLEKLMGKALV